MQFNVNESVVKMLEVLARHKSIQILIIAVVAIIKLPEILMALSVFMEGRSWH